VLCERKETVIQCVWRTGTKLKECFSVQSTLYIYRTPLAMSKEYGPIHTLPIIAYI